MKHEKIIGRKIIGYKAWDKNKKRWYHWTWIIPENLKALVKQEGLIKFQAIYGNRDI